MQPRLRECTYCVVCLFIILLFFSFLPQKIKLKLKRGNAAYPSCKPSPTKDLHVECVASTKENTLGGVYNQLLNNALMRPNEVKTYLQLHMNDLRFGDLRLGLRDL